MFEVGDQVEVTKNLLGGPNTFLGQKGEVLSVDPDSVLGVEIRTPNYGVASFMKEELELIGEGRKQKFGPGDRVVVVSTETAFKFRRGEVTEVVPDHNMPFVVVLGDDLNVHFAEGELEYEHIYDALSAKPADEDMVLAHDLLSDDLKVDSRHDDVVNHPSHYADGWSNGAEVIDITEHLNFNRGNAVKYLSRAGKKGGSDKELEDLQKALWYVTREVLRLGGTVG